MAEEHRPPPSSSQGGGDRGASMAAAKGFEAAAAAAHGAAAGGVESVEPPTPHATPLDFAACATGNLNLMADAAGAQAEMDSAVNIAFTAEHSTSAKKIRNDNANAAPDSVVPLSESQKALMEVRNSMLMGKVAQAQAQEA